MEFAKVLNLYTIDLLIVDFLSFLYFHILNQSLTFFSFKYR